MNRKNLILNVKNLSYKPDIHIKKLNKVSFTLFSKEILVIIGKNGTPKSEISDLLLGRNAQFFSGEIDFLGEKVLLNDELSYRKLNKHTGIIIEDDFDFLTFSENIFITGYEKTIEKKLDKLSLEYSWLENIKDTLISKLSNVDKKILYILRTLLHNRKLVLYENFGVDLNSKEIKEVIEKTRLILKKFQSSIIIFTDDSSVANYSDKTVSLNKGDIR